MSIDPDGDSECSSIEYLDSSHVKKCGLIVRVSSGDKTDSFDEAINSLGSF